MYSQVLLWRRLAQQWSSWDAQLGAAQKTQNCLTYHTRQIGRWRLGNCFVWVSAGTYQGLVGLVELVTNPPQFLTEHAMDLSLDRWLWSGSVSALQGRTHSSGRLLIRVPLLSVPQLGSLREKPRSAFWDISSNSVYFHFSHSHVQSSVKLCPKISTFLVVFNNLFSRPFSFLTSRNNHVSFSPLHLLRSIAKHQLSEVTYHFWEWVWFKW